MSEDEKKHGRHKKTVSLYGPEKPDAEDVTKRSRNVTEESVFNHNAKSSKSFDGSPLTRKVKRTQSDRSKMPSSSTAISYNTMEWLERALCRRRSETRIYNNNTKLLEAIPHGDTAYIHRLLAMGANPNATCRLNNVSACHIAAMYDNDVLDLLIKAGAETMRFDKLGRTPLHLAAWTGNIKQIALLLHFPEALVANVGTKMSSEALEEVRRYCGNVHKLTNIPCELTLLSTLPDSWRDSMDHNCREMREMGPFLEPGWNALHAASARVQHHCIQLLLAAGGNCSAEDLLSRTPLDVIGCAYYKGHQIDAAQFLVTIRILIKAGGKFQNRIFNRVDTPLHTAVELDCLEAVEELIESGAVVTNLNNMGLTPMHVCVKHRRKNLLQFLANYEYSYVDRHVAIVDTKDRFGYTVLRAAINIGWTQGVCITLGAGASVTIKASDGESPIHAAAALGNIDVFKEILVVAQVISVVDFRNEKGETALFIAMRHNRTEIVKLLLEAGTSIINTLPNNVNVFHVAAEYDNTAILEYLLEHDSHITAQMIHDTDQRSYTPLVYAVIKNHPLCVELLISKGAGVNFPVLNHDAPVSNKTIMVTTPLHIAARENHIQIVKIIVENDINTIHAIDSEGRLPLHEACRHGNREIITLLLHKGADLSGQNAGCKTKFTPIDILMNNLSKPTEFMQELFDSYISSQGMNLQESNCEVTVNYGILVPKESDRKQMRVIKALVNTGNRFEQNSLLLHPLVQSFLYLKWKALLPFFYIILALHMCFVLALNVYVISVFYYKDKKIYLPAYLASRLWTSILYVTIVLITVQEFIFIKIKSRRYLLCLETWLKIWAIGLATLLPLLVIWHVDGSKEWVRLIATITLLFSWFEMMFLLSRFPDWGFYILMFGKVANKVFRILLSFLFLVFGFAICFMVQFRAEPPFEGPWASFVKTMVMMTSEYDYQTTVNEANADKISASIFIQRLIFITFLILVSITLMNLIVGVAVNNVNHLEVIGNIKRLEKQVEFITSLEDIVCHKFITKMIPKMIYNKLSMTQKLKTKIILRPRQAMYSSLPAYIKEAIFEKAQLQKKQMDEEIGSLVFKMKLDKIHDAIVGKDESDVEKDYYSMRQIIEEIQGLRSDIDSMKELLHTHVRRRTLGSNKSYFL